MSTTRRTLLRTAAVTALVGGGASCARIPTSSPIGIEPLTVDGQPGAPYVRALPPPEDATPEQVVAGFVQAGVGGEDDYAVARQYLAPNSRSNWDPSATVVVYAGSSELEIEIDGDHDATLTVQTVATVDAQGVRTLLTGPTSRAYSFRLIQVQGQWRISSPPPGIFLSAAAFSTLFDPARLYFFDARARRLVPDLRWVPVRRAAGAVLKGLSEGPADVLVGSVRSFVPRASGLVEATVTTGPDGEVQVQVPSAVGTLPVADRSLALVQLESSLRSLGMLSDVRLIWGGQTLTPGEEDQMPRPVPGHRAIGAGEHGVIALTPTEGTSGQLVPALAKREVRSPVIAGDGVLAAALTPARTTVLLASTDGSAPLREAASGGEFVAPSIDGVGYCWTSSRSGSGVLLALSGEGAGKDATVDAAWLNGRELRGLQVSADDTRMLLLSADGSGARLELCAIRRDADGVPGSLSEPLAIRTSFEDILQASWYDEVSLIVLGTVAGSRDRRAAIIDLGAGEESLPPLRRTVDSVAGTVVADVIWAGTEDGELLRSEGEGWSRVSLEARDPSFY